MNELTHASIVKGPLVAYQIARNMNELTQKRSHIHASIVKSPLDSYQIASNVNKLTQERSRIHASNVTSPLVVQRTYSVR